MLPGKEFYVLPSYVGAARAGVKEEVGRLYPSTRLRFLGHSTPGKILQMEQDVQQLERMSGNSDFPKEREE